MKKYLSIVKTYFKYSLMLELEYKFNFFFGGIFELFWLIMYIVFLEVIFQTGNMGGWEKNEVLLLTFHGGLMDSLFTFLIVPGLCRLPELIHTGKLDFYLLRPINKRFYISMQNYSIPQIKNIIINLCGIAYCFYRLNIQVSIMILAEYILLSFFGFIIIYSIIFIMMCTAFWVIKMDIIMGFCSELITIGNKPYTIYPKIIQKILIYAIPIIVAFNYPVISIIRNHSMELIVKAFLISGFIFILSNFIFKEGLKKYVSTGS